MAQIPPEPIEQGILEVGRTGGWAAVLLLVMILAAGYITYLLVTQAIRAYASQLSQLLEELRDDYSAQLERERLVSDRYDATLQIVNKTFGEVGEVIRQNNALQQRTVVALDRNSDTLDRYMPERKRAWDEGRA